MKTRQLLIAVIVSLAACSTNSSSTTVVQERSATTPAPTEFSGERAFEHVRRLVELGPRPVGSEAHARMRAYIVAELKACGLNVRVQEFRAQTPLGEKTMFNLIAERAGASEDVIILASHYDTKLFTDFSFVGANDGGSSTGALLELARVLAARPETPRYTFWFVFFDGEEAFVSWSPTDGKYGSRYMVEQLERSGQLSRIRALILLDMIGDKDLDIVRDAYSTRWLQDIFWETARELGYERHFTNRETFVDDDHVPFLQKGVPAVDLIDFNYGLWNRYWHTAEDTLEKVSPRSLKIVGDVVLRALPRIEAALATSGRR
ncbi:MAG: M28 family peptidase [Blastocatellia bacterium]|nr:M28 family peptidase [Blastocatellia bacterium]MCS7156573.1 M28 family peptidase [Blastocatellia bacterium]MCX7751686.1 M28 family peptidase [Blastocatellia bacterium]MDW8168787.1 M28 family peptidase [Acidobacteriota bacterium]MDW8255674.1 M28 family peptidase [Acidobacteriota bacterium]